MAEKKPWTKEKIEELERILEDPTLSYSMIGAKLGVTRNAISGAVHRYNINTPKRATKMGRPARPKQYRVPQKKKPPTPPRSMVIKGVEVDPLYRPVKPSGKFTIETIPLLGYCRFPVSDHSSKPDRNMPLCGAKIGVAGRVYCAKHFKLAYQPPQNRRARRTDRH